MQSAMSKHSGVAKWNLEPILRPNHVLGGTARGLCARGKIKIKINKK